MKYLASLCLVPLLFLATSCGSGAMSTSSSGPTPTPTPTPTAAAADVTVVKHIVILMQENRAFDHYFGFMTQYRQKNGIPINSSDGKIRDLSDPAAQTVASANISSATDAAIPTYHTGSVCTEDLSPDWDESHRIMNR